MFRLRKEVIIDNQRLKDTQASLTNLLNLTKSDNLERLGNEGVNSVLTQKVASTSKNLRDKREPSMSQ